GERRRRRLTLALGGTLVLAIGLGVGLWDLRRRQEGALERAHSSAAAVYDQARHSGCDPPRGRALRAALRNLDALGQPAPRRRPPPRRAATLLARFRLDDAMLGRPERTQLDQGGPQRKGVIDDSGLAAEYERLFRSYGVGILTTGPADAAMHLRGGAIAIPLC